jgi:hypothetical protein
MNEKDLVKTGLWELYEHGRNYMRLLRIYSDTDLNYRMHSGNQWEGAKIEGIEQAQYNFIETIVNHKVSRINQNLWAINFSSENFDRMFRPNAEKTCEMLNRKARKVWEKDQMDTKLRNASDDSAINDEGIIYVDYNEEEQSPKNEIINKNDIQYGNEQSSDIQSQPYIVISQRKHIIEVQNMARAEGISEEKILCITGDKDTSEQPGEDAKYEKDDMVTLIIKMWKDSRTGTVWFAKSTKYLDIIKPADTGLTLYPVAHFVWKEKKGSARGEGEVRTLIPNQLELNKTLARMLLSIKQCAYAQKVANMEKIANPSALGQVGGIIKTRGNVEDVSRIFTYIQPASMSTDVSKLINDLITITRELKNASEVATGGVNPEQASGKAILAVQQASDQPLIKQTTGLKTFVEDIARIWLDMWITYSQEGMKLEEEITDPNTGETYIEVVNVEPSILENLKATVKVDVTPKGAFDRYATELTLENMLQAGLFAPQRVGELRKYAEALPEDATAPKQKILDICDKTEEEQRKIAQINAEAEMMQMRANEFLMGDPDSQSEMIMDAEQQIAGETPVEEEMPIEENDELAPL